MMGGWNTVVPMWRRRRRCPTPTEDLVTVLTDAVARIGASADKVIAALQAAGTGGEDTTAAVDALNATSDRIDAAVAVAAGTGGAPTPAPATPIAGGTPEQPAG
jgi:hypothetical protein